MVTTPLHSVTNLLPLYKSKISKMLINRGSNYFLFIRWKQFFSRILIILIIIIIISHPRSIIRQVRFVQDSKILEALTCQVHVEECRIQGPSRSNSLYVVFVTSLRSSWWRRWRCLATCIETERFGRMTKSGPRPAPASRTPPRAWQKCEQVSEFQSGRTVILILENKF